MLSLPSFDRLLRGEADIVLNEVVAELFLRVGVITKHRDNIVTRLRLIFDNSFNSVSLAGVAVYETTACASRNRQLVTWVTSDVESCWVLDIAPEVNTAIDRCGVSCLDSSRVVLRWDGKVCNSPHIGIGVVSVPMKRHARIRSVEIELKTIEERRILGFSFNVVELHRIETIFLFCIVVDS